MTRLLREALWLACRGTPRPSAFMYLAFQPLLLLSLDELIMSASLVFAHHRVAPFMGATLDEFSLQEMWRTWFCLSCAFQLEAKGPMVNGLGVLSAGQ